MPLDISTTVLTALIALVAVLPGLLIWLRKSPLEVACRKPLFKPEARSFLGQLDIAVCSHLNIFPSLPVTDVLEARRFSKGGMTLKKVMSQRFDYVLCHRKEMSVRCVIKLHPDEKSRNSKEMVALRAACKAAELPLLEYGVKPYRDVHQLRKVVLSTCGIDSFEAQEHGIAEAKRETKNTYEFSANNPTTPSCPKCAGSMKLTTIKKGERAGQECWVCAAYPECKGARLVAPEPA